MKIDVLTLFPEMFRPVIEESILVRAKENGILDIRLTDIREYSQSKHKKADDYPFGGGAGMVMLADPVFRALHAVNARGKKILYMSPRGRILDQRIISELAQKEEVVILCGHYEGVDQRIIDYWDMEEISVGDYILTGGELPAMILIDAVARMIPRCLEAAMRIMRNPSIPGGWNIRSTPSRDNMREWMFRCADIRQSQADHLWQSKNRWS